MLAVVWHYWIGVVIAVSAIVGVGAMVAGYLKSVESDRFPRES